MLLSGGFAMGDSVAVAAICALSKEDCNKLFEGIGYFLLFSICFLLVVAIILLAMWVKEKVR